MSHSPPPPIPEWRRKADRLRPSRLTYAAIGLFAGGLFGLLPGMSFWLVFLRGMAREDRGYLALIAPLLPVVCAVGCAVWGFIGREHMIETLGDFWKRYLGQS